MATIYCMNCGAPLDSRAKFCTECGCLTKLGAGTLETTAMPVLSKEAQRSDGRPEGADGQEAASAQPVAAATPHSPKASHAAHGQAEEHREPPAEEGSSSAPHIEAPLRATKGVGRRRPSPRLDMPELALPASLKAIPPRVLAGVVAAVLAVVVLVAVWTASGGLHNDPADEVTPARTATEADTDADEQDASTGSAGTEVRSSLADYSWQELSIIAKEMTRAASRDDALQIAREYGLVDENGAMGRQTKPVEVAGVGTLNVRLVDVWHDDLPNGEGHAGLTFLASDLGLRHRMKEVDDNVGGWEGCEMRAWLNGDVFNALDEDLREVIVAVDKRSDNVGRTTDVAAVTSTLDRLWIPSVVELAGPISWVWDSDAGNSDAYNAIMNAEGTQYALFAELGIRGTDPNESLMLASGGATIPWWLRSVSPSKNAHYRMVDADGDPSRFGAAPDNLGVCVGFCL